jgi:uncharacterized membrane protein HdeD (DUF308 family)
MTREPVLTEAELSLWIGVFQVLLGMFTLVVARRVGRQRAGLATAPLGAMFLITGLLKLLQGRIADAILLPAAGVAFVIAAGWFVGNVRASKRREGPPTSTAP